ncbi:MAG: hypothetical protein SOI28_06415 [Rahnella inusitata]
MSPALIMKKSTISKTLNLLGSGLAIIGVVFVIFRLQNYWSNAHLELMSFSAWLYIAGMVVVYGSSNFLLASAWREILKHCRINVDLKWATRTYGISQLAKYIPGNIFHIAGRQALGMASGLSPKPILKSNIYELALIATAGATSIWLVLSIIIPEITLFFGIILTLFSIAVVMFSLRLMLSNDLARAFALYILFLIISAVIFITILTLITYNEHVEYNNLLYIGGAYIIAWLAGLITPGAPAGVGIRELVIIFFLKNIIPESDLLLTIILGRFVTVLGDVAFYGYAHSISQATMNENR